MATSVLLCLTADVRTKTFTTACYVRHVDCGAGSYAQALSSALLDFIESYFNFNFACIHPHFQSNHCKDSKTEMQQSIKSQQRKCAWKVLLSGKDDTSSHSHVSVTDTSMP